MKTLVSIGAAALALAGLVTAPAQASARTDAVKLRAYLAKMRVEADLERRAARRLDDVAGLGLIDPEELDAEALAPTFQPAVDALRETAAEFELLKAHTARIKAPARLRRAHAGYVTALGDAASGLVDLADAFQIVVDTRSLEDENAIALASRAETKLDAAGRLTRAWRLAVIREARRTGVRVPGWLRR